MKKIIKTFFVLLIFLMFTLETEAARLPTIGDDQNSWGNILNTYLLEQHNQNGTLRNISVLGTGATVLTVDGITNRIGIGTASPSEILTVIGNVNISGYLNISGDLVINNKFNVTASSGNVNVAGILDATNLLVLGSIVQVEGDAFKIGNFTSNLAASSITESQVSDLQHVTNSTILINTGQVTGLAAFVTANEENPDNSTIQIGTSQVTSLADFVVDNEQNPSNATITIGTSQVTSLADFTVANEQNPSNATITITESQISDLQHVTNATITIPESQISNLNHLVYTGGVGITISGNDIISDLGTTISASEISTNAVKDDEIDYSVVTLNDFDNDRADLFDNDNFTTRLAASSITESLSCGIIVYNRS